MNRKYFQKSDMIIIIALLFFSLGVYFLHGFLFQDSKVLIAEILIDGQVEIQLPLNREDEFFMESHPDVVFEIRDNGIAFKSSDCPDKICVHTGYIKQAGQMAACLPNRIAVRIVGRSGASPEEPDVVV